MNMHPHTKMVLFLLLASLSFSASAQNEMRIVGRGEYLSNELVGKNVRDKNGEVCGGLMILSDLDALTFDSNNGVMKSDHLPGKVLLYLSPDERMVTVFKSGYQPLRIIMSELGIRLRSGEVWQVKIAGEKKQQDLIPISIVVDAPDALISIDGTSRGTGRTHQVSPGTHQIRIEKEGFRSVSASIEVTPSNVLFSYTLTPVDVQSVTITSIPPGARIMIDNVDRGTRSCTNGKG